MSKIYTQQQNINWFSRVVLNKCNFVRKNKLTNELILSIKTDIIDKLNKKIKYKKNDIEEEDFLYNVLGIKEQFLSFVSEKFKGTNEDKKKAFLDFVCKDNKTTAEEKKSKKKETQKPNKETIKNKKIKEKYINELKLFGQKTCKKLKKATDNKKKKNLVESVKKNLQKITETNNEGKQKWQLATDDITMEEFNKNKKLFLDSSLEKQIDIIKKLCIKHNFISNDPFEISSSLGLNLNNSSLSSNSSTGNSPSNNTKKRKTKNKKTKKKKQKGIEIISKLNKIKKNISNNKKGISKKKKYMFGHKISNIQKLTKNIKNKRSK